MTGPAGVHRVRANHREWSPPQVIFLDTETTPAATDQGELHILRLWAARLDVRRTRTGKGCGTETAWGYDAQDLADSIETWCAGQRTVWLYAHNLAFDLAVTRLPAVLHDRGWEITGHAVSSDSPWLRMRRGACVLTMCDSWGWLRAPLEKIGADTGVVKPVLPGWDDSDQAWLARCEADVEVLAVAMLQLMDWWDERKLGSWTLTGSAGGWNSWRHMTTCALPLIVPDPVQTAADRAAVYGGRREAFRHGQVSGGPFTLLDFASAYPTVAAEFPLPAARQGNFDSLPVDSPLVCGDQFGIIAEVTIRCDRSRYPVRVAGRVAYPVGEFVTVLAGPEIHEARLRGELVSIGPGWLHRLSPHMQEWARWVLDVTSDQSGDVPAVANRAVKHWGRAVIGKTAARGWQTIPLATLGGTGWDYRPAWNAQLGAASHLTEICGVAAETIQAGDGDNAYPAILAWVESWVRVFLGRAIDQAGAEHVVTCDTDGMLVTGQAGADFPAGGVMVGPLRLRRKGEYKTVTVLGPQHLITPGDTKLSGIPKSAKPDKDGRLSALLWPGLASQMALRPGNQEPGYLRPRQSYTLASSYITGWVLADDRVEPLAARICDAGGTHLIPRPHYCLMSAGPELQASHLKSMIRPLPARGSPCTCRTSRSHGNTGGPNPSAPTTSSMSCPSPDMSAAGKDGSWRSTGRVLAGMARRVFSGRTRT